MNRRFVNLLLYAVIVVMILPMAVLLLWAFAREWPWPHLFPTGFSVRGWVHLLNPATGALPVLFYSVLLSSVVTFLTVTFSLPAARALAFCEFRGKQAIEIFVLSPMVIPTTAIAMGIHVNFIRLGLADTFWGVVLSHLLPCLPYGIKILTGVFGALGDRIEQQARVMGAGRMKTYIYVTLPLISPGLVTAGIMAFVVSFSQYFLTFIIGGGRVVTFSLLLFPFIQGGDRHLSAVFSLAFIATVLLWVFALEALVRRWVKKGQYFYM
ncbi:ABC transporter permease [Thermosediminibacter litoriperuensis]|uniref:Putative spermidine/putrescine transport system permease protein n=1 Tax=Thermosediminibacter litoriperuensis TaxID=291989 RepID=A0A5S5AED8_9FIRM|nr:ABC transporter permease subunit [Thermosediminibacter litoriperuensis]TYP48411.1 putative spermidine/putrescine transport system permease protein [Thermosediminibacter litoriperuensis]